MQAGPIDFGRICANMACIMWTWGTNAALFERFTSRGDADYANRVLSAMRKQFDEHSEKKAER